MTAKMAGKSRKRKDNRNKSQIKQDRKKEKDREIKSNRPATQKKNLRHPAKMNLKSLSNLNPPGNPGNLKLPGNLKIRPLSNLNLPRSPKFLKTKKTGVRLALLHGSLTPILML